MERQMGMVERVARALSIADGMHPEAASNDGDETPAWTLYVGLARAAIEEMRVPTRNMLYAAEARDQPSFQGGDASADTHWEAMIDAALKEHEEGKVG